MMRKVNAILPMRASSQRIKNKNIRLIKGKPLYEYILHLLRNTKFVDKIIINTDIVEVIEKYRNKNKIIVIERESHLRGNCNINLVIQDTIDKVKGEYFIQVHATNPLVSQKTINNAIETFFKNINSFDSLFSVTKIQKRFWRKDGTPINHTIQDEPTTQSLEPYFEENSCFYLFSRKSFM